LAGSKALLAGGLERFDLVAGLAVVRTATAFFDFFDPVVFGVFFATPAPPLLASAGRASSSDNR